MRVELDLAVAHNIVVLTSNVESDSLRVDAMRQIATTVQFHNHGRGLKGAVVRYFSPGDDGAISFDGPEIELDDDSN